MLKSNLTCSDPLYALSEIFSLAPAGGETILAKHDRCQNSTKNSMESLRQGKDAIHDDIKQSNLYSIVAKCWSKHIEEISANSGFSSEDDKIAVIGLDLSRGKYQHTSTAHAAAHQILED
jgi:hypothetical protein